MGKWLTFFGILWSNLLWADPTQTAQQTPSSIAYIAVVVILLIVIVVILYNRQKRKFND